MKKQRVPPIVISISESEEFRQEIKEGCWFFLSEILVVRKLLLNYLIEKRHNFFAYSNKTEQILWHSFLRRSNQKEIDYLNLESTGSKQYIRKQSSAIECSRNSFNHVEPLVDEHNQAAKLNSHSTRTDNPFPSNEQRS